MFHVKHSGAFPVVTGVFRLWSGKVRGAGRLRGRRNRPGAAVRSDISAGRLPFQLRPRAYSARNGVSAPGLRGTLMRGGYSQAAAADLCFWWDANGIQVCANDIQALWTSIPGNETFRPWKNVKDRQVAEKRNFCGKLAEIPNSGYRSLR